jgi:hypothetical protein
MDPEARKQDSDSLDPETLRGIERQFDRTADQTREFAAAFFHYFIRGVLIVLVLIGIAFFIDYLELRASRNAFGSVEVRRYYAVGLKNKKTDYSYADPELQTCVNSLFPHSGYSPCWYLRRHNVKEIDI